jgi:hypothetical protein
VATIIERKVLEALEGIHTSSYDLITAIESLNVNVDNTDVLAKLQSILTANLASNVSIAALTAAVNAVTAAVNATKPILKASVARLSEILTAAIPANTPVRLFAANSNRIGFFVYNNSTNSLYGGPTNSPAGGRVLFQLASNAGPTALATFLGSAVWTGEVWVLRNAGTGGVVGYELEP